MANRTKSTFLSSMSHELRTPLNSIIGFTGIMLNELAGPLNFEQKKQLKMVRGSSEHLLSLINDVLDISKIDAGEIDLYIEAIDMVDLILQVKELLGPMAEKKGLSLSSDISSNVVEVKSDKLRVRQILVNLVNNAIKFTEEGSVLIRCKRSGDRLQTEIIDTGIGIDQENIGRLFKPFEQLESGIDRRYEGTGLGLAISKRILENLGGGIEVKSQLGKGSCFSFYLPLKREGINGQTSLNY